MGEASEGAGLLGINCDLVTITKTCFQNLTALTGGAVSFTGTAGTTSELVVTSSTFVNNSASDAGAVYTDSVDAAFQSCGFTGNQANGTGGLSPGRGGALTLVCTDTSVTCIFVISDSTFTRNFANVKGGAICWEDIIPQFKNNLYINNTALYGNHISSFPVRLAARNLTSSRQLETLSLSDLASGQTYQGTLTLAILDHYDNVVTIDDSSTAEITSGNTSTSLSGAWKMTAVGGLFTFQNFIVVSYPGTSTSINVTTSTVDVTKKLRSGDNATYISSVNFPVTMRNCVIGESLENGLCVVCSMGMYSLDPTLNCLECPGSAICYGNYTMVPKAGFWRPNELSSVFFACPKSSACTGSPVPPAALNLTGLCADGYIGNMCQSCAPGYSRSSTDSCSACPVPYVNILRLGGIALATAIVVVILVKTSITSAYKPKATHSIYLKIFMNYLQLVMLTASFNLSWPQYVLDLFSVQSSTGAVTEQIFSVDCFINENSSAEVFFDKMLIMAFVPLLLLLLSVLVWGLIALYKRRLSYLKNELMATCIILFFIVHPSIVKVMFNIYSCQQINVGEYWVSTQLNIRCWSGQHLQYALGVALPSIIIWGIGIPTICLITIIAERKNFHTLDTKIKYGFLMNGYRLEKYYWEFVILYRKLVIICISVFLSQISIPIQALAIMGVLVLVVLLQHRHKPYTKKPLNHMEMLSILVSAVTIYCGLYYLTNDLDEVSKTLFFVIIVGINAYFLVHWFRKMLGIGLILLIKRLPGLRRFFKVNGDDNLRLELRERDYFREEMEGNRNRSARPPESMKDLYLAYLKPVSSGDESALVPPPSASREEASR